jgi:hypothetical protein
MANKKLADGCISTTPAFSKNLNLNSKLRSTATEAQRERIAALLRMRPHNGYELRRAGCYQCPTRIFELRARGYDIETQRVSVVDRDGFSHRGVALYVLLAEPGAQVGGQGDLFRSTEGGK